MRVALFACAWLLLACKEACPRQHPCDQTYEAPALANPLLQIAASSQRLDARLQDATTAALRLRAALAKLDDVHARAWVEELDVKIQRLAGAWCGSVVNAQGKAVEVMSTPVDLLFPVDKVDAADRA